MRKYIWMALLAAPLSFSLPARAQNVDMGAFLGTSMYQGDLSESMVDVNRLGGAGGIFFRYHFMKHFSMRAGIGIGKISADDVYSTAKWKRQRNLSFESIVTDGYLVAEYFPFGSNTEKRVKKISPYLFGGLGIFHFNPKTQYNGKMYALQPLGTEGQGLPEYPARPMYKLTQISYPFGAGLRYNINRSWNIGLEARINKTFTDYLDDVGGSYANIEYVRLHRGDVAAALADRAHEVVKDPKDKRDTAARANPKSKDWYLFTGVTFSYMPRRFSCHKF